MNLHDLTEDDDKQYEIWVLNRITSKEALCHLYRGHKCIPTNSESCRSCYQEEFANTQESSKPEK